MALSRRDNPWSSIFKSSMNFRSLASLPSIRESYRLLDNVAIRALASAKNAMDSTCVDWLETEDAHVFRVDLPGLTKEQIKVQLYDDRVLEISGERVKEEENGTDTWHRVERSTGKFLRRFRLPENTQTDQMIAKVENGVLTVKVPKIPQRTPQIRTIEIS